MDLFTRHDAEYYLKKLELKHERDIKKQDLEYQLKQKKCELASDKIENKRERNELCSITQNKIFENQVNYIWIISILLVIVCVLAALLCSDLFNGNNTFKETLQYISTFLSIVLALFSIIFTYTSSHSTEHRLGELHSVFTKFEETNDDLEQHNDEVKHRIEELEKLIEEYKQAIDICNEYNAKTLSALKSLGEGKIKFDVGSDKTSSRVLNNNNNLDGSTNNTPPIESTSSEGGSN